MRRSEWVIRPVIATRLENPNKLFQRTRLGAGAVMSIIVSLAGRSAELDRSANPGLIAMLKSLLISACIVAVSLCALCSSSAQQPPVATVVAGESKPAKKAPAHDPPQIVVAAAIDEYENLVLVNIRTIYIGFTGESYNDRSLSKITLKDVGIFTVHGKRLSVDEARMQLVGKDTPILCSSRGIPLPAFYALMFVPDTLHFVFPKQSPIWEKIQEPGGPLR